MPDLDEAWVCGFGALLRARETNLGRVDSPVGERDVGGCRAGGPGNGSSHPLHDSYRSLDAVLVESIAAPCPAEPSALLALNLGKPPL